MLDKGQMLEMEQMFCDAGEKWPVVIPEEELRQSFPGTKVLGTPTKEEIKCMNPNYTEFKFPQIKPHPWHKILGLVNVDFADVRAIMANAGSSLMGIGTATGKTRARDAALNAVQSPLLDIGIERATGIVWNITGEVIVF